MNSNGVPQPGLTGTVMPTTFGTSSKAYSVLFSDGLRASFIELDAVGGTAALFAAYVDENNRFGVAGRTLFTDAMCPYSFGPGDDDGQYTGDVYTFSADAASTAAGDGSLDINADGTLSLTYLGNTYPNAVGGEMALHDMCFGIFRGAYEDAGSQELLAAFRPTITLEAGIAIATGGSPNVEDWTLLMLLENL